MPWNRPFHLAGSQTAMSIGFPAWSVWVRPTAQKSGSPVIGVVVPGGVKLPLVSKTAESTVTAGRLIFEAR